MYPNRIGWAVFGDLEIECLEIFDDEGDFDHVEYRIEDCYYYFDELCDDLYEDYRSVAKLIKALGQDEFLDAVLEWDPYNNKTRDAFYRFLGGRRRRR